MAVPGDDRSLQVHVCHGPMREVEVLHDQLHWLFEQHPDLAPADVVVMTPDIEAYAPCIEAVFGGAQGSAASRSRVADRSLRAESSLVEAFLGLLDLRGSRYEADRLLALLDIPAVHRRFGLAAGDLDLVQRLVRESAVRWGVDAAMRERLGLPAGPRAHVALRARSPAARLSRCRAATAGSAMASCRATRSRAATRRCSDASRRSSRRRRRSRSRSPRRAGSPHGPTRSATSWRASSRPTTPSPGSCSRCAPRLIDLVDAAARAGYDAPVSLELLRALLRGVAGAAGAARPLSRRRRHVLRHGPDAQHPLRGGVSDRHERRQLPAHAAAAVVRPDGGGGPRAGRPLAPRRRSLPLPRGHRVGASLPLRELRRSGHPRQRPDPALGGGGRADRRRVARLRRAGSGDRASAAGVQPALLRGRSAAPAGQLLDGAVRGEQAPPARPRRHAAGRGAPARRAAGSVRASISIASWTSSSIPRATCCASASACAWPRRRQPVERREPFVPGWAGRLCACASSCSPGAPSGQIDRGCCRSCARAAWCRSGSWARSSWGVRRRSSRSSSSALDAVIARRAARDDPVRRRARPGPAERRAARRRERRRDRLPHRRCRSRGSSCGCGSATAPAPPAAARGGMAQHVARQEESHRLQSRSPMPRAPAAGARRGVRGGAAPPPAVLPDDGLAGLVRGEPRRKLDGRAQAWEGNDFSDGERMRRSASRATRWREVDPIGDEFEALAARVMAPLRRAPDRGDVTARRRRPLDLDAVPLEGMPGHRGERGDRQDRTITGLFLRLVMERGRPDRADPRRDLHRGGHRGAARAHPGAADGGAGGAARRALSTTSWRPRWRQRVAGSRRGGTPRARGRSPTSTSAAILTIHGFCQRALGEHAFESGLPFDAELVADVGELLQEAVDDFWRRRVRRGVAAASCSTCSTAGHARLAGGGGRRATSGVPICTSRRRRSVADRRGTTRTPVSTAWQRAARGVAGRPRRRSRRCSATPGSSRTSIKPSSIATLAPAHGRVPARRAAGAAPVRPAREASRRARVAERVEEGRGSRAPTRRSTSSRRFADGRDRVCEALGAGCAR